MRPGRLSVPSSSRPGAPDDRTAGKQEDRDKPESCRDKRSELDRREKEKISASRGVRRVDQSLERFKKKKERKEERKKERRKSYGIDRPLKA